MVVCKRFSAHSRPGPHHLTRRKARLPFKHLFHPAQGSKDIRQQGHVSLPKARQGIESIKVLSVFELDVRQVALLPFHHQVATEVGTGGVVGRDDGVAAAVHDDSRTAEKVSAGQTLPTAFRDTLVNFL